MRAEIISRINEIITNDTGLTGIFRTYENEYPAMIQAPCTLILPRQETEPTQQGNRFNSEIQIEIRVYLKPIGQGLTSINNIEATELPELFKTAFLSRLQLQYNDAGLASGLEGVSGNLRFQVTSDLARPMEYPIGMQDAPRFWGFTLRLTIPIRQVITSKVRGV